MAKQQRNSTIPKRTVFEVPPSELPPRPEPTKLPSAELDPANLGPTRSGQLPRIAAALRPHLERIRESCTELAADGEHRPPEFVTKVRQMLRAAESGLADLTEWSADSSKSNADVADDEDLDRHAHDFKNHVQMIRYRCDQLRKSDATGFDAFREQLHEIDVDYQALLDKLKAALTGTDAPPTSTYNGLRPQARPDARPNPMVTHPTVANSAHSSTAHSNIVHSNIASGSILVVDDEDQSREFFCEMLREMGHRCIEASSGEEALRCLGESQVDLILLDLHMSGLSGMEVLRQVNGDFALRSIPTIVVSAEDRIDKVAECIAQGADDFLVKPINEILFRARINSSLRKGQLRKTERLLHEQVLDAKQRADDLLYQVFPYTIAEELRTGGNVQPRGYDNVAVLFCDIVGFTNYCEGRSPREVVSNLDRLFSAYEVAANEFKVEKIKTIGDCFMLTAGLLNRFRNPVLSCLFCAEGMRRAAAQLDMGWQVRIGIHVGPVVAGLVGRQFTFDVWGDTVNTAQRVESTAEPQGIAVSEPAWAQVYRWCHGRSIGLKPLKGKREMEIFQFEGFRESARQQILK